MDAAGMPYTQLVHMGISPDRGTLHYPQNSIVLPTGTPQKRTPIFVNPRMLSLVALGLSGPSRSAFGMPFLEVQAPSPARHILGAEPKTKNMVFLHPHMHRRRQA